MKRIDTDILIVGTGAAGLFAALHADPDKKVLMITKVAKDKSEALFEFVQILARPNYRSRRIKLKGLDPDAYYYEESEPDRKISGAALMNAGINIAKIWNGDGIYGDFSSKILHFIKA